MGQANTYEHILDCARSLIVAGGYNGFSYADIAEVVGIRKPSIHHHFPSKADLVRTLVARYRQDAEEGLAALRHRFPDPFEQLRAYIGYWETCITDATAPFCLCALLAGEMPLLPDPVSAEVKAYFRFLSRWLTAAFEGLEASGRMGLTGPASERAEIFMAAVHGAMLSARAYGDPEMFGTIVRPLFETMSSRH